MTARRSIVALAAIFGSALLGGCGGDSDGGPTPTPEYNRVAVVEVELAAADNPATAIEDVATALNTRLESYGVTAAFARLGLNQLRLHMEADLADDELTSLLTTSTLEFAEPVIADGMITCQSADGTETLVNPVALSLLSGEDGRQALRCFDPDGAPAGEVKWQPSEITVASIYTVQVSSQGGRAPVLAVTLTPDGTAAFAELTGRITGFPLAVFLNGVLISAPTVALPITNGQLAISGLTDAQLETLPVILQSGPLPAPVTIVSIE